MIEFDSPVFMGLSFQVFANPEHGFDQHGKPATFCLHFESCGQGLVTDCTVAIISISFRFQFWMLKTYLLINYKQRFQLINTV